MFNPGCNGEQIRGSELVSVKMNEFCNNSSIWVRLAVLNRLYKLDFIRSYKIAKTHYKILYVQSGYINLAPLASNFEDEFKLLTAIVGNEV